MGLGMHWAAREGLDGIRVELHSCEFASDWNCMTWGSIGLGIVWIGSASEELHWDRQSVDG